MSHRRAKGRRRRRGDILESIPAIFRGRPTFLELASLTLCTLRSSFPQVKKKEKKCNTTFLPTKRPQALPSCLSTSTSSSVSSARPLVPPAGFPPPIPTKRQNCLPPVPTVISPCPPPLVVPRNSMCVSLSSGPPYYSLPLLPAHPPRPTHPHLRPLSSACPTPTS
jgi:hypothetical protein